MIVVKFCVSKLNQMQFLIKLFFQYVSKQIDSRILLPLIHRWYSC